MKKIFFSATCIFILSLLCNGCVTKGTYVNKAQEADKLTKELATLNDKNKTLTDDLAKVTAENRKLKKNVAQLQEVEKQSNTYEELVKEMEGEIAQGQITITELEGKLTMDVVDKILFASGQSKVKKEGLDVLKRVVEILKNVKDKSIRIEGHTDNVKITSRLAKVYPTNWELSAARAINVARYLQQQGIDPTTLSVAAFGEFKPLADNSTPEGRAKNRRIAVILLPKE